MNGKRNNKIRFGFPGVLIAAVLAALVFVNITAAAQAPTDLNVSRRERASITIGSSAELIDYANNYTASNKNDDIELALRGEDYFSLPDTFKGIGRDDAPFEGTLTIVDNAVGIFVSNVPLFDCISANASIINGSGQPRQLTFMRVSNSAVPILANTVDGGSNSSNTWKVSLEVDENTDSSNPSTYNYGGLIGEIKNNANLTVEFSDNSMIETGGESSTITSRANIISGGNVGVICGTLGEDCVLNAAVGGTNFTTAGQTVTSLNSNAGGIVGEMGDGAKLNVVQTDGTGVTSIEIKSTVIAGGGYAGGLVGYAVNADINESTGYTDKTVSVSGAVSGTAYGAGGIFGYYSVTEGNQAGNDISNGGSTYTFDLSKYITTVTLYGGCSGGVFGKLETNKNVVITDSDLSMVPQVSASVNKFPRKVAFASGEGCGGIIGTYVCDSLLKTLEITNNKVRIDANTGTTVSGGLIGSIADENPAYVKISNVAVNKTGGNAVSGGLIGDMGTGGSFLDTDGLVSIRGSFDAGLVSYQNAGVIRLKGITDLDGYYFGSDGMDAETSGGQLVSHRGNGLVYALGSGSDSYSGGTSSGWTFFRHNKQTGDDISDWGEVLRLVSNGISEADVLTYNSSAHTVTLNAGSATIDSKLAFIKTALNIQHNVAGQPANGSLRFASGSATTSTALLAEDLSITDDIDLSGTGILSLTRDNGTNAAFTGSLNGNGNTVTLAIGENYGMYLSGAAVSAGGKGSGMIYGHGYNGLIAKTSSAEITDLTVDGNIWVAPNSASVRRIGGFVASVSNGLTLSEVTAEQSNNVEILSNSAVVYCGGAIGCVETSSTGSFGTLCVTDARLNSAINEIDSVTGSGSIYMSCGIGAILTTSSYTVNMDGVDIGGSFTNSAVGKVHFGGLISYICQSGSNNRILNLKNINVLKGFSAVQKAAGAGTNGRGQGVGGFLGYLWNDAVVTIGTDGSTDGVVIGYGGSGSAPKLDATGSSSANIGGLCYKATGYWRVNHLDYTSANIVSTYGSSTLGLIVNDGCVDEGSTGNALLLEVISDGYLITEGGVSITAGKFNNAFDEIMAYSVMPGKMIEDNGQAIISIRTPNGDPLIMDGSACNTYQNRTAYGKTLGTNTNENSRYYYNLDQFRGGATNDPEKLMLWSLRQYAHSKIKAAYLATDGLDDALKGNFDMAGYSYYPVKVSKTALTIGGDNTVIKFYNDEIETGESQTGNTDSYVRTTVENSANKITQHYLMHCGILIDTDTTTSTSGSTTIHNPFALTLGNAIIEGSVGRIKGTASGHLSEGSGFLICGMLGGDDGATTVNQTGEIKLHGAFVNGAGSNNYAPLLINRIGKNTTLNMTGGVDTDLGGYNNNAAGDVLSNARPYAASSLIGRVGDEEATNIRLSFSDIRLDARTSALSNGTANSALNAAYGTTVSIFDRATLLESFRFLNNGSGEYNYNLNEDWNGTSPLHHVTYGEEVSESVEYSGRECNYYDYYQSQDHYTSPENSNAQSQYSFASGFLPYVYHDSNAHTAYDPTAYSHELRVNVREVNLDRGCGQYNDPYMITDGGMLYTAARIISGVIDEGIQVMLPSDIDANGNASSAHAMWHDSTGETDRLFTYKSGTGGKKFYAGANDEYSYTADQVRKYLAGAYYKIVRTVTETNDGVTTTRDIQIDLPAGFSGLGAVKYKADLTNDWSANDFECPYAFHGVIVGETGAIIVNHSANPLIKNANGCVVRNVAVSVDASVTISQNNSATAFTYAPNSCASYGAVMGQVMGGDNIIDAVSVDFTDAVITVNDRDYTRLVPVGGYVGVVVNGGLIFRNMTASGVSRTGLTNSDFNKINDPGWLYVNPIIGRVLAGYAFTESASYQYAEGSVTMNNSVYATEPNPEDTSETLVTTVKNYVICDFAPASASNKLTVTANGSLFNIGVPDAQALHVLSFVVNSGAGSAGSNGNYAAINGSPWIAYRNYAQIRCADYDEVGSAAVLSGDYATVEAQDKYSGVGSDKIPYVIRTYTADVSGTYNARRICGNGSSAAVSAITFSQGVYNLSAGYRGIGNIYKDDNAFKLRFKSIAGNNATINLNMVYLEYNHQSGFTSGNSDGGSPCTTYTGVIENYRPYSESAQSNVNVGFGLFNVMYHVSEGRNDTISNLTLTGSVFYDIRKMYFIDESYYVVPDGTIPTAYATSPRILYSYGYHNYKSRTGYYRNNADRIDSTYILHTGGLAGLLVGKTVISGVTLDGLTVEGAKYTGGLIGFSMGNEVAISGSSAQGITVIGGFRAGGLIGGFFGNAKFSFTGTRTIPAVINLTNAEVKGYPSCAKQNDKNNATFAGMFHSVGGLCGSLQTGTANSFKSTIEYVDVTGQISAPHADQRPNDLRYKIASGGLFGKLDTSNIDVKNTSVSNLTIEGNLCGGAVGYVHESMVGNFTNISISDIEIESKNSAGGLIGFLHCQSGTLSVNVDRMSVLDCEILSDGIQAQSAAVGGIVGGYTRVGGTGKLDLANVLIKDCEIERHVDGKPTDTPDYKGVGGLFGDITDSNINTTGHNILIDNLAISDTGNYKADPGVLAGTLTSDTSNTFAPATKIRLVGVSVQNCPTNMPMVGNAGASQTPFGTVGYVIMADFNGDSLEAMGYSASTSTPTPTTGPTADPATLTWMLMSTANPTPNDYYPTAPYVVNEPQTAIGASSDKLTSDGMNAVPTQLPIYDIIEDTTRRYEYALNGSMNGAAFTDTITEEVLNARLSTFTAEAGGDALPSGFSDFSVLVIEDLVRANTTKLINAYLNLLANTRFDYGTDQTGVFKVEIYKMTWQNGHFVKSNDGEPSLRRNDEGQFYMVSSNVDSNTNNFSLIDVKFFDPADSSKIAYHLYVPVFAKKLMMFDFSIASGNGTIYDTEWYDDNDRWGEPVMENLGSPVTVFFEWGYQRSAEEWQALIDGGDNMRRNYAKSLIAGYSSESNLPLPNNTVLVLVDRNNGDKPYYARFGDVFDTTTNQIDLSLFRTGLGSGSYFAPVGFDTLLSQAGTLTAEVSANGTFVRLGGDTDATIKVGDYYYRLAEETDPAGDRYSITFTAEEGFDRLCESYYISIFTAEDEGSKVYHHRFYAPQTFPDSQYPSKLNDEDPSDDLCNVILGNIFKQENVSVDALTENEEIDVINNTLNIDMHSEISIYSALYSEVKGFVSSINICHSFLTRLTQHPSEQTIITGSPTCSGTYTVSTTKGSGDSTGSLSYGDSQIEVNPNYVEFITSIYGNDQNNVNIGSWLVNEDNSNTPPVVTISASVSLKYSGSDAIEAQFPMKADTTDRTIGLTVSGSSNVGFEKSKLAVSNATVSREDGNSKLYYCVEIKQASLSFNANRGFDGDEDKLGINPLDPEDLTAMTIDATGVYNIHDIISSADGDGYNMVHVEIRLYSKSDGYSSANPLVLSSYFTRLSAMGGTAVYSGNGTVFSFDFARTAGEEEINIPIVFSALTGAGFEALGHDYSNYKVEMTVWLYKNGDSANELDRSRAFDYFIYTNARILPDFID